jgi:IclR family pca regulon transcriptional regulator
MSTPIPANGSAAARGAFEPRDREFVHALARGLAVIEAFSAERPEMTLSQVAEATATSPATARRSLLTLQELGFVRCVERRFSLTARVLALGGSFLDATNLRSFVQPVLTDLAEDVGHTCAVTVLDGSDVVYIAHAAGHGPAFARHYVGARLPAHATSTGHVHLAALDADDRAAFLARAPFARYTTKTPVEADELHAILAEVRCAGYATVVDTVEYGAAAIAVPVVAPHGRVVAALNSSASSASSDAHDRLLARLPALRAAADRIEAALHRFPALSRSA